MTHKVHWIVGLSNGENATEGKGNFQEIEGELSPWNRLLSYCEENGVHITSLSLGTADGGRWNLPSAGKNPKFREFNEAPKPVEYKMFRKAAMEAKNVADMQNAPKQELHTCIEATYQDGTKLQVWVDEDNFASWSMIL